MTTTEVFDPQVAESRIRVLGRELNRLEAQRQGARENAKDIIEGIELDERIREIQSDRTELGRKLLAHDRQRVADREEQAAVLREEAHARLADLKERILGFHSKAEIAFTKLGGEFLQLRDAAEELRILDSKVNFLSGKYAISAGHLVKPVALNALIQTMLSETFDVSSFEAFPESLAHELERIEKAVEPR